MLGQCCRGSARFAAKTNRWFSAARLIRWLRQRPGGASGLAALVRKTKAAAPERARCCRSAILLVAGDKSGQWKRWYREAIPEAEQLYATYLKERQEEAP